VKRIDLPAPIFFAWLVLTVVLMVQGTRLAQDRQETLEPRRVAVLAEDPETAPEGGHALSLHPGQGFLVHRGDPPGRLALYQVLPERRLLRWIEDEGHNQGPLLIPLTGLGPGDYAVADAPARSGAASHEMDRPEESLPVRARFTLLPD
jgi:hypothetical protein